MFIPVEIKNEMANWDLPGVFQEELCRAGTQQGLHVLSLPVTHVLVMGMQRWC